MHGFYEGEEAVREIMGDRRSAVEKLVDEVLRFYEGKRVFITGHTGFKGSWLCKMLVNAGALVSGFSLNPEDEPSLFMLSGVERKINHMIGDIRNYGELKEAFDKANPQIVFHLAAQPLVAEGYSNPRYTYDTNVMGTVNLLECIRTASGIESVLIVTTDKVYLNHEWCWGYREEDCLDGYDPYSNSKSCAELVTHCYDQSFLREKGIPVSTARAGNVIGGGDFSKNRIIPDCVRASMGKQVIKVRNPYSVRPYQHVLEPLFCYLMIAAKQAGTKEYAGNYNVGPEDVDCITTGELADLFCRCWGEGASWKAASDVKAVHEANYLKLDCSRIRSSFGWRPRWHINETMDRVCRWNKVWLSGGDVSREMDQEISEYLCWEKIA